MLLEDARSRFRTGVFKGTVCECCGRYGKVYPRRLHKTMAAAFIVAYKRYGQEPFDVPTAFHSHAEFQKLRFWQLIDRQEHWDAGVFQLTDLGVAFAQRKARVPGRAFIYANKLLKLDGKEIDIAEALTKKFSYEELMA